MTTGPPALHLSATKPAALFSRQVRVNAKWLCLVANVSSGGDFLPIVKYDARAGRMFRVDRDPISGEKTQVDITGPDLRFAIDFGSLQVGYVQFTANGPVRSMAPYGKPLPAQPQDKDEAGKLVSKPGFYVLLIAGKGVGGSVSGAATPRSCWVRSMSCIRSTSNARRHARARSR